jgi:hypothetical protein
MIFAPTRVRLGSHLIRAPSLAPAGDIGMSMVEISGFAEQDNAALLEGTATETTRTIYLCHPFLLPAGQPQRATPPPFLSQLPVLPKLRFKLTRTDGNYSLVE